MKSQDIKTYRIFVVSLGYNKVKLSLRNDSVTPYEKIARGDLDNREGPKDSESSSYKKKEEKDNLVAPVYGENIIPIKYINTQKVNNAPNFIIQ